MTAALLALVASYVVLAVLLLSLNLRSSWRWPVKGGAIAVTASFFVIASLAIHGLLGWPTEAAPPARFQLHAALIREPARRGQDPGAIYLWLSPKSEQGEVAGSPRAYALPYSRALHAATARAQAKLQAGQSIDGQAARNPRKPGGLTARTVEVELYDAPATPLPPKIAG